MGGGSPKRPPLRMERGGPTIPLPSWSIFWTSWRRCQWEGLTTSRLTITLYILSGKNGRCQLDIQHPSLPRIQLTLSATRQPFSGTTVSLARSNKAALFRTNNLPRTRWGGRIPHPACPGIGVLRSKTPETNESNCNNSRFWCIPPFWKSYRRISFFFV